MYDNINWSFINCEKKSVAADWWKHFYLRTNTTFAMQILQARFRTLPSALTTSGDSSIPNLVMRDKSNRWSENTTLIGLPIKALYRLNNPRWPRKDKKQKISWLTSRGLQTPPSLQIYHHAPQGFQTPHPPKPAQYRDRDRSSCAQQGAGLARLPLLSH